MRMINFLRNGQVMSGMWKIAGALVFGVSLTVIGLWLLNAGPVTIQGVVVDEAGPVAGAVVRVQATTNSTRSDGQGRFELTVPAVDEHLHLTAWSPGYFISGNENPLQPGMVDLVLTLHHHPTVDNPDYVFISPLLDMDNDMACGHCHVARPGGDPDSTMPVDEWLQDAHAISAINPRFLSLYDGTTVEGESGPLTAYRFDPELAVNVPVSPSLGQDAVGPGFRLDFPDQGGSCAMCHVPVEALVTGHNADPNLATGVALEGATCDFCHKIEDVRLRPDGLPDPDLPGVLSLEFLRPHDGEQVFLGPYDDVPGEDIYAPILDESVYCAACHVGTFWGVTMYNSFGEWLASPYSDPESGQTCQDCHMPHVGATVFAQLPPGDAHNVPYREPETIFSHLMPGAADLPLLATTVFMTVDAQREGDILTTTVSLTNVGAGHHVPTDNPLRNMILVVQATDADGNELTLLDGPTISEWGGVGDPAEGYYAGQPGVLYAKILADFYTGETPTYAYWRQTRLVSDNRLAAFDTDETAYTFALPSENGSVTIEARLVLRRAFIELMDLKNWDTPDMLMAEETLVVAESSRE